MRRRLTVADRAPEVGDELFSGNGYPYWVRWTDPLLRQWSENPDPAWSDQRRDMGSDRSKRLRYRSRRDGGPVWVGGE